MTFVESVLDHHDETSRSKLQENETLKVNPRKGSTIEYIKTLEYDKRDISDDEINKYFETDIGYDDLVVNEGGFSDDEIYTYFETDIGYDDYVVNEETIQYQTTPQESLMTIEDKLALTIKSDEEREEDTLINFTSRKCKYKTDEHTGIIFLN